MKTTLRMTDFTPNEIVAANEALGCAPQDLPPEKQILLAASMVWVYRRRTEPDLTFAEVCDTPVLRDYRIAGEEEDDDNPEPSGGDNGAGLVSSLAPGG